MLTDTKESLYTEVTGVDSSVIKNVYYDSDTHNMFVEFNNGNVSGYKQVPRTIYREFITAPSAGAHYNRRIKGQYPGVEVGRLNWRLPDLDSIPAAVGDRNLVAAAVIDTPATTDRGVQYDYEVTVVVKAGSVVEAAQAIKVGTVVAVERA